MDEPTIQFLKQIGTALSASVLLALGCWKLWNKVEKRDAEIAALNTAHEDAMKAERERHATEEKALQDRVFSYLEKLTAAMRSDSHG